MTDQIMLSVLNFSVGGKNFALPVACVNSVMRTAPLMPVPRAKAALTGLFALHGKVIAALSLGTLLGIATDATGTMTLIVTHHDNTVGLLVDCIGDVNDIASENIVPHGLTHRHQWQSLSTGIITSTENLTILLDLDQLLENAL